MSPSCVILIRLERQMDVEQQAAYMLGRFVGMWSIPMILGFVVGWGARGAAENQKEKK